MALILSLLLTPARAASLGPWEGLIHLTVNQVKTDPEALPPLYRDHSTVVTKLHVWFEPRKPKGMAILEATYEVQSPSARERIETRLRAGNILDGALYNVVLEHRTYHDIVAAQFINVPTPDTREVLFGEPSLIIGTTRKAKDFFQEISVAVPAAAFEDPARDFFAQVRLKHFAGDAHAPDATRGARFYNAFVRVNKPTADEWRALAIRWDFEHHCITGSAN